MKNKTVKLEIYYNSYPFELQITSNVDVKTDYILGILFDQIHILENTNAEVLHFIEERELLNTITDVIGKDIPDEVWIQIEKETNTLDDDYAGVPTFVASRDIRTYTCIGILERLKYFLLGNYEQVILEADETYTFSL